MTSVESMTHELELVSMKSHVVSFRPSDDIVEVLLEESAVFVRVRNCNGDASIIGKAPDY